MRSRTELVTTTFIDSEDDFTETDDSEEDWRPSASNRNVKKRSHGTKGRSRGGGTRKRKSSGTSSSGPHKNPRRQTAQDANYRTFDDSDDDDEDDYEYYKARTQLAAEVEPKAIILPPKKKEKNLNGGSGMFQLYLYRKDLKEDYMTNPHLCLWRKDGSNLLQKYIRVKTGIPEEFIFTSSSVYSTWDEKRRRDFLNIAVKCLEENNRRVTFVNTTDLHSLAKTELERVSSGLEQVENEGDDENDADADIEADVEGSEHNSGGSECDDNDGSYHPEEEDAEEEPEDDNIDENEEDEQVSEDDQGEEEFEDYAQVDEEEDEEGEEEDDNIENDDNENENEAQHN